MFIISLNIEDGDFLSAKIYFYFGEWWISLIGDAFDSFSFFTILSGRLISSESSLLISRSSNCNSMGIDYDYSYTLLF